MDTGAIFSENRYHRYVLWRIWDADKPKVLVIGLNPSTAGEEKNDPTINRLRAIAEGNGFGGFYMMNCFSSISPYPSEISINSDHQDINRRHLLEYAKKVNAILFAWGNFAIVSKEGVNEWMVKNFPNALCLHINKNGSPKHPLYCPKSSKFKPYINWD